MRALALVAAAAVAGAPAPTPGIYCSVSGELAPISIERDGSVGIDGLDCRDAVIRGGRLYGSHCFTNSFTDKTGGPYETTLNLLPSGEMVHEMEIYRLRKAGPPCP